MALKVRFTDSPSQKSGALLKLMLKRAGTGTTVIVLAAEVAWQPSSRTITTRYSKTSLAMSAAAATRPTSKVAPVAPAILAKAAAPVLRCHW